MGVDPSDFESRMGISWEAFRSTSPEVARYVDRMERLIGAISFGFGTWGAIYAGTKAARVYASNDGGRT